MRKIIATLAIAAGISAFGVGAANAGTVENAGAQYGPGVAQCADPENTAYAFIDFNDVDADGDTTEIICVPKRKSNISGGNSYVKAGAGKGNGLVGGK